MQEILKRKQIKPMIFKKWRNGRRRERMVRKSSSFFWKNFTKMSIYSNRSHYLTTPWVYSQIPKFWGFVIMIMEKQHVLWVCSWKLANSFDFPCFREYDHEFSWNFAIMITRLDSTFQLQLHEVITLSF